MLNGSTPSRALAGALLALLALAAGCQSGPRPAAEFVQQAELLHGAALQSAVVNDEYVAEYLAAVGKRIVAGATAANANNTRDPTFANMKFHLVASDVVNAFGTGGGHIYLYNGLLQRCDSEEELAAALAVQYAHALDLDVQGTGMKPDTRGATDRPAVDRVAFLFVSFPFSAQQVLKADERAFEFYARGGWDPARFADVYENLRAKGLDLPPSIGGGGQPRVALARRAAEARSLVGSLPSEAKSWKDAPVAHKNNFKRIVATADAAAKRAAKPDDRGLFYLAAFPNVVLPAEQPAQQRAQAQLRVDVTPPAPVAPPIEPN